MLKWGLAPAAWATCWFSVSAAHAQVQFAEAEVFEAGHFARCVALADLDQDGDLDAAVVNRFTGKISIMLNVAGSGQMVGPDEILLAIQPRIIAAGDFNEDGAPDLAVADSGGPPSAVRYLMNRGGVGSEWLGFMARTTQGVGVNAHWVEIADINGDGHEDFIVANYGVSDDDVNTIAYTLGDGNGFFEPAVEIDLPVPARPIAVAAADLDGDSLLDLAVCDERRVAIHIFRNLGEDKGGEWLGFERLFEFAAGQRPRSVEASDVDADGQIDLLIANLSANQVRVAWNDGFAFPTHTAMDVGIAPEHVIALDVDGDGRRDIASGDLGGSVYIARRLIGRQFEPAVALTAAIDVKYLAAGDLDADGDLDIAAACANTGGPGQLAILLNETVQSPVFGDQNADGLLSGEDIALVLGAWGPCPPAPCPGDLDGDGSVGAMDVALLLGAFLNNP